tara:strand:+ start:170 stop:346 length:177 start_codon:yes stop_codon:yes gene_type:complete
MNTLKAISVITVLLLIVLLFLSACEKEKIINEEPIPVEFKEDSVTNKVGCYYPLYNQN